MGYQSSVAEAALWLEEHQNSDGGWGLTPGQASSLVNTGEALFVLRRAGLFGDAYGRGLDYLKLNTFEHLATRGPRIRYVTFSLTALIEAVEYRADEVIAEARNWLLDARNDDNGWPTEKGGSSSELLASSLAVRALRLSGVSDKVLEPSYQWFIARAGQSGWSLKPPAPPTPLATGYALGALSGTAYESHVSVRDGLKLLLQTSEWGSYDEAIEGTVWKHTTFPVVIPALMALGEDPYSPAVAEGIRYINRLRADDGGWHESEGHHVKTIRAQYWATVALDSVQRAFDPVKHVLRIDSERAQVALGEPTYVNLAIRTRWAVILPAQLYRGFVFALLFLAGVLSSGVLRIIPAWPRYLDHLVGGALLIGCWSLIRLRRRQFPRLARPAGRIALIVVFIGTLTGNGLATVIGKLWGWLHDASDFVSRLPR